MYFFYGETIKLKNVILYWVFNISQISLKFECIFTIRNINSHTKKNHCIIRKFYRDASNEFTIIFVSEKCFIASWNLYILMKYTGLFHALNVVIVSCIDLNWDLSKLWMHCDLLFSENAWNQNKVSILFLR